MSCPSTIHADEYDRAEKETFTKWVNTHLMKVGVVAGMNILIWHSKCVWFVAVGTSTCSM